MSFEKYLKMHIKLHPCMKAADLVKLCYQAARGGEHMLADISRARAYLCEEFDKTKAEDMPLYEEISDSLCRVNIAAWKYMGLSADRLFEIFEASAKECRGQADMLEKYLETAKKTVKNGETSITSDEWDEYITGYIKKGMPPVSHSNEYRDSEKPAYRVVRTALVQDKNAKKD